ncbi:hypothetical protein AGOR_G00207090 [Albula goreensis]|uniref:INO80 complex subunit E n=1 Tax=Albula goreensis TaxID=1534307 RepID=A0A8T3CPK1_9TELE|nr:hypothetical protein AGOR_G00207090 [Albula goreensis]
MPFLAAGIPGWILSGLCFGLLVLAQADPEFSECSQSFYKHTPPVGFTGPHLLPLCNKLEGGRTYATLYNPFCDIALFSAFCLDKGWGDQENVDGSQTEKEENESQNGDQQVLPLLLRHSGQDGPTSSSGTPGESWDSAVSALVRSSVHPQCRSLGGDLYVLSGRGGVGGSGEGCSAEADLFWTALCCAVPDEGAGFSLGMVNVRQEGLQVLDMNGLEEIVGTGGVFSGGCGESQGVDAVTLAQNALQEIAGKTRSGAPVLGTEGENTSPESTEMQLDTDNTPAQMSLLFAPLRPVTSTVTQIPGQVYHVIREDLAVLSSLPCDTLSVFYNVIADTAGGVMSAGGLAGKAGALCASQLYTCTWPLVGALFNTCRDGVMGVGMLTWDGVGVFGGMLDKTWSVSKYIGGKAWEQSQGYLGAVLSESGGQVQIVGGGLGKLVMKGGKGCVNVLNMAWRVVGGTVGLAVDVVKEAFGND